MVFRRKFVKKLDFVLISSYNFYIALKGKSIFLIRSESSRWVRGGKEELCSRPGAVCEAVYSLKRTGRAHYSAAVDFDPRRFAL